MGKSVADVMTTRPRAVTPETPVSEVAQLMETEDVGAIPVVDGDTLLGIVTDRDIVVRAVARGKDPSELTAGDVSSEELVTVGADEDLSDALNVMARYQVRRLPVVDSDNRLVGVVSQADVALVEKEKTTGDLVADISTPPRGPRVADTATDRDRELERERGELDADRI